MLVLIQSNHSPPSLRDHYHFPIAISLIPLSIRAELLIYFVDKKSGERALRPSITVVPKSKEDSKLSSFVACDQFPSSSNGMEARYYLGAAFTLDNNNGLISNCSNSSCLLF